MARFWVKAGINDRSGKPFSPPLRFRCQKQITDKDTPILVRGDADVVSKIKDASLVKCSAPKTEEKPATEKKTKTK